MSSAPPEQEPLEPSLQLLVNEQKHPSALVVVDVRGTSTTSVSNDERLSPEAAFPPGSTIKPLTYAHALMKGTVAAGHEATCNGVVSGEPSWTCFQAHGSLTMADAIATSCNVYGWTVADALGWDGVRHAYGFFGLLPPGEPGEGENPWRFPAEIAPENEGEMARLVGIGHGPVAVPLGRLADAYVRLIRLPEFSTSALSPVRAGMILAVEGSGGTAGAARIEGWSVMGKTGTADAETGQTATEYGWFVGAAPVEEPVVVVAALVQGGDPGGASAAPLAARALAIYRESLGGVRPSPAL